MLSDSICFIQQTRPLGQGRQLVMSGAATSLEYVPVGQAVHVTESTCDRYVPCGHTPGM